MVASLTELPRVSIWKTVAVDLCLNWPSLEENTGTTIRFRWTKVHFTDLDV